jgi:hypothetical protein
LVYFEFLEAKTLMNAGLLGFYWSKNELKNAASSGTDCASGGSYGAWNGSRAAWIGTRSDGSDRR